MTNWLIWCWVVQALWGGSSLLASFRVKKPHNDRTLKRRLKHLPSSYLKASTGVPSAKPESVVSPTLVNPSMFVLHPVLPNEHPMTGYLKHTLYGDSFRLMHKNLNVDPEREIVFGQSGPLIGEGNFYTQQIISGINAKFGEVNTLGGIQGRLLRLITLNDFGSPELTVQNIRTLQRHDVELFVGNLGTPNLLASLPFIYDRSLLMLFPYASHPSLSVPYAKQLINSAPSYQLQIDKILQHLINELKLSRIALVFPNDQFGRQQADYAQNTLRKWGRRYWAICSYNPDNPRVFKMAEELMQADPEAVISLGTYLPTSRLISRFIRHRFFHTKFYALENCCLVSNILKTGMGSNFAYTSCMPHPASLHCYPLGEDYLRCLKKFCPTQVPTVIGFAYFLHASIIVRALSSLELNLFPAKDLKFYLCQAIEKLSEVDLGGVLVDFNFANRQAYPLQPTIWQDLATTNYATELHHVG